MPASDHTEQNKPPLSTTITQIFRGSHRKVAVRTESCRFGFGLQTQRKRPPSLAGNPCAGEERSGGPSPVSPRRSPQPPLQDGDGGNGVTFLPTHCPRSCRRLCGAGNRRSCRWRRDGPSSRSRTSPSRGSDPDLCQSSDRRDLPGREDTAAHREESGRAGAQPGLPSSPPAISGTADALQSPCPRQLAR